MSVYDEAAGVEISVTKRMETETDGVTEGVVATGVITEEVTVSNEKLSSDEVTDDDEDHLLIEEGT